MGEIAIYARQSVESKNSLSIEGQIQFCRRLAGDGPVKVYRDKGFSGKNTERPAFKRLLQDIKAGRIDRLYVYRLDRFSRSVADFGNLWQMLQRYGVEFVSVSENFDTSTPMGRAMLHIVMAFAQLERETTAERVRDNCRVRAAAGAWPGGPPPFGFDLVRKPAGPGGPVLSLLQPNEKASLVLHIFREYARPSCTLGSLGRQLAAAGAAGPRRAFWTSSALSRVLHNPIYVKADEQIRLYYLTSGTEILSPESAFGGTCGCLLQGGNALKNTHSLRVLRVPGIVPADLFLACQEKLSRNRSLGGNGSGTSTWLSGLLKCADCGYSMKVIKGKSGRHLVCSGRYTPMRCSASTTVSLDDLETRVTTILQEHLTAPSAASFSPLPPDPALQFRLAELDRRSQKLLEAFSEGSGLPRRQLEQALQTLEQCRRTLLDGRECHRRSPGIPAPFSTLAFSEKKELAARFIRRIDVGAKTWDILFTQLDFPETKS